jgi:hypothetical protein
MKIILEYRILDGTPLQRGAKIPGVKVLTEQELKPDHPADFPLQRIEFFVEETSEAARGILGALGVEPKGATSS